MTLLACRSVPEICDCAWETLFSFEMTVNCWQTGPGSDEHSEAVSGIDPSDSVLRPLVPAHHQRLPQTRPNRSVCDHADARTAGRRLWRAFCLGLFGNRRLS